MKNEMENLLVRPSLSQEFTNLTVYRDCKSEKMLLYALIEDIWSIDREYHKFTPKKYGLLTRNC